MQLNALINPSGVNKIINCINRFCSGGREYDPAKDLKARNEVESGFVDEI